MTIPKVSVLMSVHNGQEYLNEAIMSILNQTFTDFEFLILNDASTDNSADIINSFNDSRLRIIDNESNLGLTRSLLKGLALARGEYIARMDSDDISLPGRLAAQVAFLEAHPEIGICGTWAKRIGQKAGAYLRYPVEPEVINCRLLFDSPLAHPSVMIRKDSLSSNNLNYDPQFKYAQDYDLWTRCSRHFSLANIAKVLLLYRVHSNQIGSRSLKEQTEFANLVRRRQVERLGLAEDHKGLEIHNRIGSMQIQANRQFVIDSEEWLQKILAANMKTYIYPETTFSKVVAERWFTVCRESVSLGPWVWEKCWESSLSQWIDVNWKRKTKFWLLSLLKRN